MNIGVSSIGFENLELSISKLKEKNINYLELIFTKIGNWDELNYEKLIYYKKSLDNNGIKCKSAQSLFYNTECYSFSDDLFFEHFKKILKYSKLFGIDRLVLGSPNLRKKEDLNSLSIVFSILDEIFKNSNINVCIEPNAKKYNGNYFFDIEEIYNFIVKNNYENIFTMIDLNNSLLENKNPFNEYEKFKNLIKHIHISQNNLNNITEYNQINEFINFIKKDYKDLIIFEVLNISEDTLNYVSNLSKYSSIT